MSNSVKREIVVARLADLRLSRQRHLPALLGYPLVLGPIPAKNAQAVARLRWSGNAARVHAKDGGVPLWWLDDGFLRSGGVGKPDPSLSLLIDDLHPYWDSNAASRLEMNIDRPLAEPEKLRAEKLVSAWRDGRLSKFNHLRERPTHLPARYVLVVDQKRGDPSIAGGAADRHAFGRMLRTALAENPQAAVLIWSPETVAGHLGARVLRGLAPHDRLRITVVSEPMHPAGLLANAECVHVVTSYLGFEALLWGKRVKAHGMPFFAGWGLTDDDAAPPSRRGSATLEQLVHAAFVGSTRYVDPETHQPCEAEAVFAHLALQRSRQERFAPTIDAVGFSNWKHAAVRRFFQGSKVRFVTDGPTLGPGERAVWGRQLEESPEGGAPVLCVEDGFLRSVGLGANLVQPVSWVIDRSGIYYDATRTSDLESILETAPFDADLLRRAQMLRGKIIEANLTKYNVGPSGWQRPTTDRKLILVPGQVESDLSIRYGAASIRTNMDLLKHVRGADPRAFIIYKPHPDVLAGRRPGSAADERADDWCDAVVTDANMAALLSEIDEVHTLTSLAGFEALLRGKTVRTYGMPFYAGWGLTHDLERNVRRIRRLTLDELVAGALILYPIYVSRTTGRYTTPERAIDELVAWRASVKRAER